jgi:hypothetical protein
VEFLDDRFVGLVLKKLRKRSRFSFSDLHAMRDRRRFLMKRRHRIATGALAALLTVLAAVVGAGVARGEGGGQNQFPCSSTTLRAGALLPELVPDQQLLVDEHVVWRDPQTGQFLLAFSSGIQNLGTGTLNVVGYRDSEGRLQFAGRVGSGFTNKSMKELLAAFEPLRRADSPFAELPMVQRASSWTHGFTREELKNCVWLEPKLACEVQFTEWTEERYLRHPVFKKAGG